LGSWSIPDTVVAAAEDSAGSPQNTAVGVARTWCEASRRWIPLEEVGLRFQRTDGVDRPLLCVDNWWIRGLS
jgi:hypothetical protein